MSIMERCDNVVGDGSQVIAGGRYTVGEGEAKETRYKFGIKFDYPEFTEAQDAISLEIGRRRQISVEAASVFNEKNDYGSIEDAKAFQKLISTPEGWVELQSPKKREGGGARTDTFETLAIKTLATKVLKPKFEAGDGVIQSETPVPRADDPPKTAKGQVNFIAWAKEFKAAEHPWYTMVYNDVKKDSTNKFK